MFDIGWTEMLVVAVVLIVIVGPKDLPKMLRTFGKTTAKLRAMAGDFQRQFNEALKEAELDDVKKSVDELRGLNPASAVKKHLNPFEKAASDLRAGLESMKSPAAKPAEAATPAVAAQEPATSTAHPAEPLKNGAAAMPGVAGPEATPSQPVMTPLNGAASAAPAKPARPKRAAARKASPSKADADSGQRKAANGKTASTGASAGSKSAGAGKAKAASKPRAGKTTAARAAGKTKASAS